MARFLKLTRSTLTFVTGELMEKGLVIEAGQSSVSQTTGRPGTPLKLKPDGAFFLGAELVAEHIHAILINLEGLIVYRETLELESSKPESVAEELVQMVKRFGRISYKARSPCEAWA